MSITIYHYPDGWGAWCSTCNEVFSFGNKSHVEVEAKQHICPTPLALDGAIAPDNQQSFPADVLVGEGTNRPASKANR